MQAESKACHEVQRPPLWKPSIKVRIRTKLTGECTADSGLFTSQFGFSHAFSIVELDDGGRFDEHRLPARRAVVPIRVQIALRKRMEERLDRRGG